MATDSLSASIQDENLLGTFLKDCRARLDPKEFGFTATRRRTPGLRREEVAQRADVSATWYTWLEQGRGGVPSADVLDRLSGALALNTVEREYLFLLAQHRPPEVRYEEPGGVTPRLQRVLDSLELCPALIKTSTWDIVAWNRAASAVLADYSKLRPEGRNLLRIIFINPVTRANMPNWEGVARFSVASFRADAARSGASEKVKNLVDELSALSPEFAEMWRENEVGGYGEGTKHVWHPSAGPIVLEYSAFAVDGQSDLRMIVFTPATPADAAQIGSLLR